MMQVIKLASSTEFATKIRKVSNFCTEVIHFQLEALHFNLSKDVPIVRTQLYFYVWLISTVIIPVYAVSLLARCNKV